MQEVHRRAPRVLLLALPALVMLAAIGSARHDEAHAAFFQSAYVGDTDCSGAVDVQDALNIVKKQASVGPEAPCLSLGNVLCQDAFNLQDMLVLLEYIAGFPVDLSAACFPLGPPVASTIVGQDTTMIPGTYSMDFDTGATGGDDGVDAWWSIDAYAPDPLEAQLEPDSGSGFAILTGTDYDTINAAFLGTTAYTDTPINGSEGPANQLANGVVFAVRTSEGNFAKVQVLQHGYSLQVEWVTYAGPN